MPEKNKYAKHIGLALSGGGFRATLYHCGALIRLNELKILSKLKRITSVSGGSITSARLAARWGNLAFDGQGVAQALMSEVINPLRIFCDQTLDLKVIGLGLIPFTKSGTQRLANAYDKGLLGGMLVSDLPEEPDFIFQSTNLQTGKTLRFERERLADYTVGQIKDTSKFRVAEAVAASSAFPPVLSPVKLGAKMSDWSDFDAGTKFFGDPKYMKELNLTDGGVNDNLGLNRIEKYGTILCPDAGKPFNYGSTFGTLAPRQVLRALNIAMDQTRSLRIKWLYNLKEHTGQKIGIWDIDNQEDRTPPPGSIIWSPTVAEHIAKLPTQLRPFSVKDTKLLINWGYVSCDEVYRTEVDNGAPPPTGLPYPNTTLT